MNTENEYPAAEIESQIDSHIKIIDSIFSTILSTLGLHHEIANSLAQATETNIKPLVSMEQNRNTQKKMKDVEMKSNTVEEGSSLISISNEGVLEYNDWPILFPLAQQC
ncbi:hypothetical protein ACTA71_005983 [Dictyostelium dimigraforme]